MRIGIDARFLGPEGTGIGRYVDRLIENLEKIDKNNYYIVFLRKANWHLFNSRSENFSKVLCDAHWYTLKEQLILPLVAGRAKLDLLHIPHFNIPVAYRGKMIVTIHDLTKSEFKDQSSTTHNRGIYQLKHFFYEKVVSLAVRKASHILTPSEYVKKKLQEHLKVDAEKVTVTYEAADPKFSQWREKPLSEGQKRQVLYKYNIREPFLIYVGNAFPFKNLDRLLEAMKSLDPEIKLINPSVRTVFYERLASKVHRLGLEHRVVLPGYVPDEDLSVLYRSASVYVLPSLSEGFGLPALEAMASGLAVACSDIPVLREVCDEAAAFFDPYSPKSLASVINKVLREKELREDLISKGLERVKDFSWEETAKKTLKVYETT